MGKRRLPMKQIENRHKARVTFLKRRIGILRKVMELSILCDVEVLLHMSFKKAEIQPLLFHSHDLQELKTKINTNIEANDNCIYFKEDYSNFFIGKGLPKKKKDVFHVSNSSLSTIPKSTRTCKSVKKTSPKKLSSVPSVDAMSNHIETHREFTTISDDDSVQVEEKINDDEPLFFE